MKIGERVRVLHPGAATLAEGPVWDERDRSLYWVDIDGCTLHRARDDGTLAEDWHVGQKLTCLALRQHEAGFIAGLASSVALLTVGPLRTQRLASLESPPPQVRCNDGKCDAAGRFWVGSCDETGREPAGYLHRLTAEGTLVRTAGPFICTNGPAVSPEGGTLYCVDSFGRRIIAFDLLRDGALSGERNLITFEDASWGYPDGLTCDAAGDLWVAHWGGSRVSRFAPTGKLVEAIALPVSQPTSCTLGGEDYRTLFVTSASVGISRAAEPLAGAVLAIDVATPGLPAARYPG